MPSSLSRRQVIRLISFLSAGTAAAGSVPFSGRFFANKVNAQTGTVYVRENIATFLQSPEKIDALSRGVQEMLRRNLDWSSQQSPKNPNSWNYQANIYGVPNEDKSLGTFTGWNTCQHGGFFFFSWHRMYLYFFERILRQASGDSNLALPYWDYSNFPDQRVLPEPFRIPADSSNPLYIEQRGPGINQGTTVLTAAEVTYAAAFRYTDFTSDDQLNFGSESTANQTHQGRGTGALEAMPHDQVHKVVGGSVGWMGKITLAARDPVFWLHHANIDRLWERWLQSGGGRDNPPESTYANWYTQTFTFFDVDPTTTRGWKQVTLTAQEILDTARQLQYRYDDPSLFENKLQSRSNRGDNGGASPRKGESTQVVATTSVNKQKRWIELRDAPLTLNLQFTKPRGSKLFSNDFLEKHSLVLNVKKIEYNPEDSIPYEIYINLPEEVTSDRNSPYYAGRLALFALPQRATFSLDITSVISELQRRNPITGDSILVTFVPPPEEITELQRTGRSIQVLQGGVRFRRVTITAKCL